MKRVGGPRGVAIRALRTLVDDFPDVRPLDVDSAGLEERDAALAHAIAQAAVVRWLTIVGLCERGTGRGWGLIDPIARCGLLAGCAQFLHLTRVPAFAAVSDTVGAIKALSGQGPAGFVNAGLRGVLRLLECDESGVPVVHEAGAALDPRRALPRQDGSLLALREKMLPADPVLRAAAISGVPTNLAQKWLDVYGPRAEAMTLHALASPPTTLFTACVAPDVLSASGLLAHDTPGHCVLPEGESRAIATLLRDLPGAWVQDAASTRPIAMAMDMLARSNISLGETDLIIDLCAGNGTKTRQLLGAFPHAGAIVATDPDTGRSATLSTLPAELQEQAARGARFVRPGRVRVCPIADMGGLVGQASLVLLDVPCGNTGVLPRRPEARLRAMSKEQLPRLVGLQREILRRGHQLAKPGGVVLYATCSLEPEENQQQAAWAVQALGMEVRGEEATLPAGLVGEGAAGYRDASYGVLLRKR